MTGPSAREPLPEATAGSDSRPPSRVGGFRVRVAPGSTLPPLCAHCGEVGNIHLTIRSLFDSEPDRVVYFRCGSCHPRREREETVALAVVLASATLSVALGIGTTLALGFAGVWFVLGIVAISAYLGPFVFERFFSSPDPFLEKTAEGLFVHLPHPTLAGSLVEVPETRPKLVARSRGALSSAIALAVWSVLLYAGRTELFVFHHEPGSVLLIDERIAGFPLPSLVESPKAGLRLSLFAGSVKLALVSRDGRELLRSHAELKPGRSYLFAEPPPGQCFTLHRGESVSRLVPREVAELPEAPASWLEPPQSGAKNAGAGLSVHLSSCDPRKKKTRE